MIFLLILYVSILLLHIGCSNEKAAEYIVKIIALLGALFWLGGYRWFI